MKGILKSKLFNWDEKLSVEDILTTISAEDINLSGYYITEQNKKISRNVFKYIIRICRSCGIENSIQRRKGFPLVFDFSLWFRDLSCQNNEAHKSIFHEFFCDAFADKKKIFTHQIIDGIHWTGESDNNWKSYPITILNYEKEEDLLKDMVSAANYIKENLDAGKNRDN